MGCSARARERPWRGLPDHCARIPATAQAEATVKATTSGYSGWRINLESRTGSHGKPPASSYAPWGGEPDLENSTCQRTLRRRNNGHEITDDELNAWVATFPIEAADCRIRVRRLPLSLPPTWPKARQECRKPNLENEA